jgi:ribosomal protein S18 acetylase RimI-like enzyme
MSEEYAATGGHPLDHPALSALAGPQARFAVGRGRVLRYQPDVAPWTAVPEAATARDWADIAALSGPGGSAGFAGYEGPLPDEWEVVFRADVVQMMDVSLAPEPFPEAVVLGAADVPEMLDLVERTRPGPFLPRTVELGTYLGVRRGGRLVAMAGERMRPPGWTEISAVCTDPDFRGQGLARRLVLALAAGIKERGETPFLHAAATNTVAVRLYESLGFALRRKILFTALQTPADAAVAQG